MIQDTAHDDITVQASSSLKEDSSSNTLSLENSVLPLERPPCEKVLRQTVAVHQESGKKEEEEEEDGEDRYSRQVKLWGAAEQARLQRSHVCLIGASASGLEALKCLVLAGLHAFTVVDSQRVSQEDTRRTVLLDSSKVGAPRALAAAEALALLNPACTPYFIDAEIDEVLYESGNSWLQHFDLVLISKPLGNVTLYGITEVCYNARVPLIYMRTYGFLGFIRSTFQAHYVIEPNGTGSFRGNMQVKLPTKMWPELAAHVEMQNKETLKKEPYIVILLYFKLWMSRCADACAKDTKDLFAQFKQEYAGEGSSSFEQAEARLHLLLNDDQEKISESLQTVFKKQIRYEERNKTSSIVTNCGTFGVKKHESSAAKCPRYFASLTSESVFMALARAVREFYEMQGRLPLSPDLPDDLAGDEQRVLWIRDMFARKAETDARLVATRLSPELLVDFGLVQEFCKNAQEIQALSTPVLFSAICMHGDQNVQEQYDLSNVEAKTAANLFAIVACERCSIWAPPSYSQDFLNVVLEEALRLCSEDAAEFLKDTQESIVQCIFKEMKEEEEEEIVCGSAESLLGAVAAQEALKLLTARYVPVTGAVVCDLRSGRCCTIPDQRQAQG